MSRARRRSGRDVHGILLLDKPAGIGSNTALQRVKQLYQARKAGHTGNLDVLASGLLPICFGEATKLSGFLLDADKHYRATFRLGVVTTTGDANGEQIATCRVPVLDAKQVKAVLRRFVGEINQIPPMYSAIKHQGQPLYKLAYQGLVVDRKPRTITIHALDLLRIKEELVDIEIRCSKGTYVRTLAEDVGAALGCGAHVCALRRVGAGPFDASEMVALDVLEQLKSEGLKALDAKLVSMDRVLAHRPAVLLSEDGAYYLRMGQPVVVPHAPTEGWVRLYSNANTFLGVGEVLEDGRIAPRRLITTE
ncbi:MAG: tRNA pseudouridine(55) synthase TruB [Gammaproteobacteria bacterium]|nr:tRNA pseudouridine(55) synthase TruB [Gammaproteobacteria bacterium]MCI0590198.1 tRNA pseudouridine(55) synthase TruB [Gammaproteobacteria bacterium]